MDKYDKAIELLTRADNPRVEIYDAWAQCSTHPAGCLFGYVSKNRQQYIDKVGPYQVCGCLTQIRREAEAETPELTLAIRADKRIPKIPNSITLKDLPVFAEWQRRIDKELGREV